MLDCLLLCDLTLIGTSNHEGVYAPVCPVLKCMQLLRKPSEWQSYSLELQLRQTTDEWAQIYPYPQKSTKTGLLLILETANRNKV